LDQLGHVVLEHPRACRVGRPCLVSFAEVPLAVRRPHPLELRSPGLTRFVLVQSTELERNHPHLEHLEPERLGSHLWVLGPRRNALELIFYPVDPYARSFKELVLLAHEPPARYEDAEVRTRVPVTACLR